MDMKPFVELPQKREITIPWLPDPLKRFYELHEGVGLESSAERLVRLCKLDEVQQLRFADLRGVGYETTGAWTDFRAIRIGASAFLDEIVLVEQAPSTSPGAIMCFGPDIAGPGGTGINADESSLVLATTFEGWLTRLMEFGWIEFGLIPGNLDELPPQDAKKLRAHFRKLNPQSGWAEQA